jgi:hypothetical protein
MWAKRYLALAIFSIAFGVEEAIIVVYLRHLPNFAAQGYALEVGREACTLVVIAALAWLAGNSAEQRAKAFCFTFGAWDIVYYLGLWQLSGFPTIADPDVLFLIPVPWVAPVWAAMAFAATLMLIGVLGVPRERSLLLLAGFVLGWVSFVYETAFDVRAYPVWLFVIAILLVLFAVLGPLGRDLQKFGPREVRGGRLE